MIRTQIIYRKDGSAYRKTVSFAGYPPPLPCLPACEYQGLILMSATAWVEPRLSPARSWREWLMGMRRKRVFVSQEEFLPLTYNHA